MKRTHAHESGRRGGGLPTRFLPPLRKAEGRKTGIERSEGARRRGLLDVLELAAKDDAFLAALTEEGSDALKAFSLTWEEKAALLSGDIRWIEERYGALEPASKRWLLCRLQQERW